MTAESPKRIEFLRRIVETAPAVELEPLDFGNDVVCVGRAGEFYLMYFGIRQPAFRELALPAEPGFVIEILDTWEMTVERAPGVFSGDCRLEMPGKPYIALRIMRETDA